ncbi:MAG: hypothetical protein E6I36_12840 [Chloroflexi bacterium]|nr:MAG: hypothetical protein E6I36_12840 [Chloroflexota bacterium]
MDLNTSSGVGVDGVRRYSSAMVAVVGYLVAAAAAIAVACIAAGRRYAITREASIDLGVLGSRHVAILGGLAGFAVTGLVLLVGWVATFPTPLAEGHTNSYEVNRRP